MARLVAAVERSAPAAAPPPPLPVGTLTDRLAAGAAAPTVAALTGPLVLDPREGPGEEPSALDRIGRAVARGYYQTEANLQEFTAGLTSGERAEEARREADYHRRRAGDFAPTADVEAFRRTQDETPAAFDALATGLQALRGTAAGALIPAPVAQTAAALADAERFARAGARDPGTALASLGEGALEALPGMAPSLALGAVTGGAALPAQVALQYAVNAPQSIGAQLADANHDPATGQRRASTEGERVAAWLSGGASAVLESVADRALAATFLRAAEGMPGPVRARFAARAAEALRAAGREGTTEGAQQVIENAGALAWDEDRGLFEGATGAALTGAVMGGGVTTAGALVPGPRRTAAASDFDLSGFDTLPADAPLADLPDAPVLRGDEAARVVRDRPGADATAAEVAPAPAAPVAPPRVPELDSEAFAASPLGQALAAQAAASAGAPVSAATSPAETGVPKNSASAIEPDLAQADPVQAQQPSPPPGSRSTLYSSPSNRVNEGNARGMVAGEAGASEGTAPARERFTQPLTDPAALVDRASRELPAVRTTLARVATALGGRAQQRVKGADRIDEKVRQKRAEGRPGYGPEHITDYLGGRVILPTLEGSRTAVEAELKAAGYAVRKVDDYFERPTPWGYRAVHLDVTTPDGFGFEVQVHTAAGMEAMETSHKRYERWRTVLAENGGQIPPHLEAEHEADLEANNRMWEAAAGRRPAPPPPPSGDGSNLPADADPLAPPPPGALAPPAPAPDVRPRPQPAAEGGTARAGDGDGAPGPAPVGPARPDAAPAGDRRVERDVAGDAGRTTALNKAAIAAAREALGLDALPPARRTTFQSLLDDVVQTEAYNDAERVADRVLKARKGSADRLVTPREHVAMVVAMQRARVEHEQYARLAEGAHDEGRTEAAWEWQRRVRAQEGILDKLTESSQIGGSEIALALATRRVRLTETFSLASVLRGARSEKGADLTEKERAEITRLTRDVERWEARVAELEGLLERGAERAAARAVTGAYTSRAEATAKRREAVKDERAALLKRLNAMTGRAASAGVNPAFGVVLGKLALTYAKEARLTLQEVVDRVLDDFPEATPWDVVRALAAPKRRVPPRTEAALERARVERSRAAKAVRAAQRALAPKRVSDRLVGILGAPRALAFSGDMSAVLRQGHFALWWMPVKGRPKTTGAVLLARSFARSLPAFLSEHSAEAIDLAIRTDPRQDVRDAAGLEVTELGEGALTGDAAKREEAFFSRWVQRMPLPVRVVLTAAVGGARGFSAMGPAGVPVGAALGAVGGVSIKASERHFTVMMNLLRVSLFDAYADAYPDAPLDVLKAYARLVNVGSGRGDLGRFNQAAPVLSTFLSAPRWTVSRFQYLATPFTAKGHRVRAAVQVGAMAAGNVALLFVLDAVAAALGYEDEVVVGTDPDDPDFGKLVWGPARLDFGGGFRDAVRLMTRQIKVGTDRAGLTDGEGEKDPTKLLADWIKYKIAPGPRALLTLWTGKNAVGEREKPADTVTQAAMPLGASQTIDVGSKLGPGYAATTFLANWFGVGGDAYDDRTQTAPNKALLRKAGYRPLPGKYKKQPVDADAFGAALGAAMDQEYRSLARLDSAALRDRLGVLATAAREAAAAKKPTPD